MLIRLGPSGLEIRTPSDESARPAAVPLDALWLSLPRVSMAPAPAAAAWLGCSGGGGPFIPGALWLLRPTQAPLQAPLPAPGARPASPRGGRQGRPRRSSTSCAPATKASAAASERGGRPGRPLSGERAGAGVAVAASAGDHGPPRVAGEVTGLEAEEGKEGMGLGCVAWPEDSEHVGRVSRDEVVRNSDCPMATLASRSWSPELACSWPPPSPAEEGERSPLTLMAQSGRRGLSTSAPVAVPAADAPKAAAAGSVPSPALPAHPRKQT